ncbi:MAG: F0F1 ATP synthase subunit A [Planctomycetota bacterium]
MSDALLHIKDSYYFELPKFLWRSEREGRTDFPEYWVRLDDEYQDWEASEQYDFLATKIESGNVVGVELPPKQKLLKAYQSWRHENKNYAKPFDRFLEEAEGQEWFQKPLALGEFEKQLDDEEGDAFEARIEAATKFDGNQDWWGRIKTNANDVERFDVETPPWSDEKIESYNHALDGKVLIPQPFGTLRNNYQKESGFAISKFMILELVVAAVLVWVFTKLATKVQFGRPVKKKAWNMFEAFLLFLRDEVARPAIGGHDADRFVPLLWTIFMFVLGCNLLGMIPFMGAPTGSFSVTLAMAGVTFATVVIAGSARFGILGFWKNQVPSMGLPMILAIFIVPMLFLIEVLGLFIKHAVLGIRLLANMVAGHLVLLAIMGMAVAAAGTSTWPVVAPIAVIGSALFSVLELFVAFLQAYVFTFLSALFIGSAVHHH